MKIHRLLISGFGCLRDLKLEFSPGLNVIFGKNESGKTTLSHLLRAMLKGFPGWAREMEPQEITAYQPWNGGPYSAQISVETDHNRTLDIEADFAQKKYEVKGLRGGALKPPEARWELYESVFLVPQGAIGWEAGAGAPVQQIFEAESAEDPEVRAGQSALQILRERLTQLDALQDHLLKREEDCRAERAQLADVLQKQRELEREVYETQKHMMETARALASHLKALQLLERRFREFAKVPTGDLPALREMAAHIKRLKEDEKELDGKAQDITQAIKQLEEEYESLKRYAGLTRRDMSQMRFLQDERDRRAAVTEVRLKELEKERKRQEEARERLTSIKAALGEDWDQLEKKLNQHEAQLETIDIEHRRLQDQKNRLAESEIPAVKKKVARGISGIAAGVVLFLAGSGVTAGFFKIVPLLVTGILVALVGGGLISAFGMFLSQVSAERAQKETALKEVNAKLEELDQRKTNIGVSLQAILTKTDCTTADGVRRLIKEARTLAAQVPTFTLEPYQKALQEAQTEERRARQMLIDLLSDLGFSMEEFPDPRLLESRWDEAQAVQSHLMDARAQYDRIREQLLALAHQRMREENLFSERLSAVGATNLEEFEQRAIKRATYEAIGQTLAEIHSKVTGVELPTAEEVGGHAGEDPETLMKNAETLADQLRDFRDRYDALTKTKAEWLGKAKRLPVVEEESLRLQAERSDLTFRRATLHRAISRLQKALEEYTRALSPVVNQKLSDYLVWLTAGTYHEGFAERSLALSLKTDRTIPESRMSFATRSQAHLAFRLALADLVEDRLGVNFPMILDEPVSHWDHDRALAALRVLADIGRRRQIFLFTSHKAVAEEAARLSSAHVIHLNPVQAS
ncbi:MAG: ATP-binding protein [bacterium JZ-2024 1]